MEQQSKGPRRWKDFRQERSSSVQGGHRAVLPGCLKGREGAGENAVVEQSPGSILSLNHTWEIETQKHCSGQAFPCLSALPGFRRLEESWKL